ncbi:PREDICTED: high affinity immunoglobulin epsilon receptor subunit alpha [Chrysochloris asiatica]|uniref:high affinity immunoglobulin epsilon receptor subunit alpha n=1 Tax=Chrysochloris asiatica TaxID=185453 RepID=UPI0003F127AB|nr:PREDICTED: high affinity immunoglobulin epsilon receptor subunit alpha [Chrysochloris asiatica]
MRAALLLPEPHTTGLPDARKRATRLPLNRAASLSPAGPSTGVLAATQKPNISLIPPWNTIFREENVTLICTGNNSLEANSIKWFLNDTILSTTTLNLDIVNANSNNSGKYTCQSIESEVSKPVWLKVFSDWLLLQVSAEEVTVGMPLEIRCHSWKNLDAYKVIYYKDGKAFKYWYENHNISIQKASLEDNGTYHCEGFIQKLHYVSKSLAVFVKDKKIDNYWLLCFIPLLVGILFIVDTGLFILTKWQFKLFLKMKRTKRGNKHLKPQPNPDPKED